MKTHDEIKKGLESCPDELCHLCQYKPNKNCMTDCMRDALAYIAQLESRLAQVERERDAAVVDIETAINSKAGLGCHLCKHYEVCDWFECVWEWRGVCAENTKED